TWISSGATLSTGIARGALQFTGAAYAQAPDVITTLTDGITLEAWVRWDGGTTEQVVAFNGDGTDGYGINLLNAQGPLQDGGQGWAGCDTCAVTPGAWNHLAAVRSNGAWAIYQNGVSQTVSLANLPATTPSGRFSVAGNALGEERL